MQVKAGREHSAITGDTMTLNEEELKASLRGIAASLGSDEDTRDNNYCWRVYDGQEDRTTHWTKDYTADTKQKTDPPNRDMTIIYWDE